MSNDDIHISHLVAQLKSVATEGMRSVGSVSSQ